MLQLCKELDTYKVYKDAGLSAKDMDNLNNFDKDIQKEKDNSRSI